MLHALQAQTMCFKPGSADSYLYQPMRTDAVHLIRPQTLFQMPSVAAATKTDYLAFDPIFANQAQSHTQDPLTQHHWLSRILLAQGN